MRRCVSGKIAHSARLFQALPCRNPGFQHSIAMPKNSHSLETTLLRIAEALERLSPAEPPVPDFEAAEAFVWQAEENRFLPVAHVNRMPIELLKSVDRMRDMLACQYRELREGPACQQCAPVGIAGYGEKLARESRSCRGRGPAGESGLKLIEIHREDISSLPRCLSHLRDLPQRFIVFCDDLSFDADDTSYKSLKAVLEGGIEGRPENVVFYATSNRRHLMPREMMENERATAIAPGEAVEEKVSLSDRFGLWIGFHNCSQADYLDMVTGYAGYYGLKFPARAACAPRRWNGR